MFPWAKRVHLGPGGDTKPSGSWITPSRAFSRGFSIFAAILFLLAVSYNTAFPGDDPHRCRAGIQTGRWIDKPDANGNRKPFHLWQPDGCTVHKYKPMEIKTCLGGRDIVVGGDSTSRGVAAGFGRLLNREQSNKDRKANGRSDPYDNTYHTVTVRRFPNVWLHGHEDESQQDFMTYVDKFAEEKAHLPSNIASQEGPGLLYIAGGAWYTNRETSDHASLDPAGRLAMYRQAVTNLSDVIAHNGNDLWTKPMDPIDGVGNLAFMAPPAGPHYEGNDTKIFKDKRRRAGEVQAMQAWFHEVDGELNFPLTWAIPYTVEGQNKTWKDDGPGFHVRKGIAEARANILLNARCNAILSRTKGPMGSGTCCIDYGGKPLVQNVAVAVVGAYLIVCILYSVWDWLSGDDEPRDSIFDMQTGLFAMALLMCYFTDRTQMMAKGLKVFYRSEFNILIAVAAIPMLLTIPGSRKKQSTAYKELPQDANDALPASPPTDEPLLSRDQTEEWKGWMQVVILCYHWTNAMTPSIYTVVRSLVASYLFQTGYGHTLFFLSSKSDFSFKRFASVMLRLNLLTCCLAYVMNLNYMGYYFAPLVTFWYMIVWVTMWAGHKRYNNNVQHLIVKICISCLIVTTLTYSTPIWRWIFWILKVVFNIHWSLNKWNDRIRLDIFIVYVGMLFAVATTQFKAKATMQFGLRMTLAVVGVFTLFHYFTTSARVGTSVYKIWHPYTSFIPILAWIAVRNCAGPIRNHHSTAMAWIGRCSLETYILQFHLLLGGSGSSVIIVDGFYGDGSLLGDRWRTLIIIVPVFLWISSAAGKATGHLVKAIMHSPDEAELLDSNSRLYKMMERWGINGFVTLPKLRIGTILLVMWLLNLMSPFGEHPPLHGRSDHRHPPHHHYTPHPKNTTTLVDFATMTTFATSTPTSTLF